MSDSAVSDSKMSMVAVMPPKNFVTQMYTEDEELGGGIGGSNNYQLLKRVSQLLDSASMRNHEHQESSYLEEVFIVCLSITFLFPCCKRDSVVISEIYSHAFLAFHDQMSNTS